jgi:glycosyltransferase involved in cell wall biosynthesis
MQHSYLRESGYAHGLKSAIARLMLHQIRMWDTRTAHGPNEMIANSAFIARRIQKIYGRQARIIYPPVVMSKRKQDTSRGAHFLAAGRLVPYKNIESIILAFRSLPDLQLIVAGDGPEMEHLKKLAGPNVLFQGFVSDENLRHIMATARAFIFAAEEDFGIIPVEAMSEGTPVLALGRGGVRESVTTSSARRTGMFFGNPNPHEISDCVRAFVAQEHTFAWSNCREQASRFSVERFRIDFTNFVDETVESSRRNTETHRIHQSIVRKQA